MKKVGEFFETKKAGYTAEMRNIFEPHISDAPCVYVYYAVAELRRRRLDVERSPPTHSEKN